MTPHEEYVQREKAAREWRAIVLPKMNAAAPFRIIKSEPDALATRIYFNNRHQAKQGESK